LRRYFAVAVAAAALQVKMVAAAALVAWQLLKFQSPDLRYKL